METSKSSIDALLIRSHQDLEAIKSRYKASLAAEHIDTGLKIDIKNLCGNLRSALDYLAHDIHTKHCPGSNRRVRFYFPVSESKQQYKTQMAKWFPGLDTTARELWEYFESIQPYHEGRKWLGVFNFVNNENKHGDLVEQTRLERERISVSRTGLGQVDWDPKAVRFGPGVSIMGVPVNPQTQLPAPHPSLDVKRVIWVDFRLDGTDTSALQLLKDSMSGVADIVQTARKWL